MKPIIILTGILSIASLILFTGCGSKPASGEPPVEADNKTISQENTPSEESGATFDESKGLLLDEETKRAIEFQSGRVEEHSITPLLNLKAHVYRSAGETVSNTTREEAGYAYATSFVDAGQIGTFKPNWKFDLLVAGESRGATLMRIDSSLVEINGKAELILRIEDPGKKLEIGQVLNVSAKLGDARKTKAVPLGAVLETAEGKFIYKIINGYCTRVSIKTGLEADGFVEIATGLDVGDEIVRSPVNRLYLLERNFTNAGAD